MKLIEVGKQLVLMSEDNGVFVHVTNGLLTVVFHPFASVIVSWLTVIKYLQAVLAPRLRAVGMLGLVVLDVRLFSQKRQRAIFAPIANLLLMDQQYVSKKVPIKQNVKKLVSSKYSSSERIRQTATYLYDTQRQLDFIS